MFVFYFWECRKDPLNPPRKKEMLKQSAPNYVDIQICLEERGKMEISALEESKGLSQEYPAKARVGLPGRSK